VTGWFKANRNWQAGATLVEVLVATVIMSLALSLIVGTLSTGLLDSTVAKRDTAAVAVQQYEIEQISAAPFDVAPQPSSDCFATENASSAPTTIGSYRGSCPSGSYTLRADLAVVAGPAGSQQWTVTVVQWPGGNQVGSPVSVLKINR